MTGAQTAREFVEKGWRIRYRGGNAVCSTPSDLDLVVADAPGDPPRYSVAAWLAHAEPPGGHGGTVLDLYDAERGSPCGCAAQEAMSRVRQSSP